jgi:hypothetical protein
MLENFRFEEEDLRYLADKLSFTPRDIEGRRCRSHSTVSEARVRFEADLADLRSGARRLSRRVRRSHVSRLLYAISQARRADGCGRHEYSHEDLPVAGELADRRLLASIHAETARATTARTRRKPRMSTEATLASGDFEL